MAAKAPPEGYLTVIADRGPLLYVPGSPTFTIVTVRDSDRVRLRREVIQSPTSIDPDDTVLRAS